MVHIPKALALAALLVSCKNPEPTEEPEAPTYRFVRTETLEDVSAMAAGPQDRLWVVVGENLAVRDTPDDTFDFVSRGDLPAGHITFLGTIDGTREWLFAHVHGEGFFRNWANSGEWQAVDGLQSPLLEVIRPGLRPIPTGMVTSEADGVTWLSTIGGLYYTADEGITWDRADTSSSGDVNLVFTDVDASGSQVAAVSLLPEGLIPQSFTGLLSGRVFLSNNSGLTWETPDAAFPSNHPTSVAIADDGTLYVGTMDQGVVRSDTAGGWTPLFGPTDVTDVEWVNGGLTIASATRGLWRLDGELLTQVGRGNVVDVEAGVGILRNGEVYELEEGEGDPAPPAANGDVHVALSFYSTFYHSGRGDTPNESGFGQDIRVMTSVLDWLDANPGVRADWVFETERTLDERMPEHSPELMARIQARVGSGTDDVRLTTSTGAPMPAMTREEQDLALARAKDSVDAAFDGWVPGAQPAGQMITPDDIGAYRDLGVEWLTLFYGANGYTGPRNAIPLEGIGAHNPFTLTDPQTNRTIKVVPTYHHGDLLDHGGLEGWVRQLNANHDEDTLLVLHFDADAESWENFDRELRDVVDLPFVRFTTIEDYVSSHDALGTYSLQGDVASGVGDGFSSWAEKSFNQEIWTKISTARRYSEAAELLAPGSGEVTAANHTAVDARLDALALENFGLTQPTLDPDRVETAEAYADAAVEQARIAYGVALEQQTEPLGPQALEILHPGVAGGLAYVPFRLRMPAGQWEGEAGLVIERGNNLLPIRSRFQGTIAGYDVVDVEATVVLAPGSRTLLDWQYDPGEERHARGSLTAADIPSSFLLQPPFVECVGGRQVATGGTIGTTVGPWGLENARIEEWQLPSCQSTASTSTIRRRIIKRDSLPGAIVEVSGTIDQAADAGGILSLVLAPVTCPNGIETLTWRSHGDSIRTRDIPDQVEAWNPVAADGWIDASCRDGSSVQIAIDRTYRSSMAPLALRNVDGEGLLVPLGTLWGDPPWHDGARTGGTGMADLVTPLIGGQFRPPAPEWAGNPVVLRMWVTQNVDPEWLDLFAKPPLVRSPLD